jgi:hypothetical protein
MITQNIGATHGVDANSVFHPTNVGLSTNEPNFDQYDFYYNLEELQKPPTISNMQLPTSQN